MPREMNTSRTSPQGSFHYWGEYASTADLPNKSAGIQSATNFLNRGDQASVAGEIYVCTDATQGAAVWRELIHSNSTATLTLTGAIAPSGGITPVSALVGVHNWLPIAATSGTDTTFTSGTQLVGSVQLPANMTITGAKFLVGSVGGTDRVYAVLYSAAGAVLANSTLASNGTVCGTAAEVQSLAFTATYAATGPGTYFVGISGNGTTCRVRTVPAQCLGSNLAGTVAQTHATVAAITVPTTQTGNATAIVSLY